MGTKKEEIAQLVKSSRIKQGFTQQELADMVGISLRSVQRIESAEVLPRYYTLKILATHLHFAAERLRDNTPDETEIPKKAKPNRTQRFIATLISTVIIILLAFAFISQSANFPETQFELFIFLAGVVTIYGLVLFRIWK